MTHGPSARDLVDLVFDDGSWISWDTSPNRAGIGEEYAAELAAAEAESGVDESVLTGEAKLHGRRVAVLTAGHCGAKPFFSTFPTNAFGAPIQASPFPDSFIDLEFMATIDEGGSNQTTKMFRATNAEERTVERVFDPYIGNTVFLYGKTSNTERGEVIDQPVCSTAVSDGKLYCKLASVQGMSTAPGDSGGPIFFGTDAHGFLVGQSPTRSYFTLISSAWNRLDTHVRQN